jgi:hypothetical protein
MAFRSRPSSIAFALAATLSLTATTSAQAQNLLDFLWGGGQEWGGDRQDVSFDPKYTAGQIIVSFGDRRLYLITRPGHATSYPIAVPREQSRWQGTTTVSDKRVNPSWRPTPEMFRENPKLPTWVPGGHPMNPLGVRAMYLGASTYRIHGTDAPWTIGQAVSKGCIRMFNEDVLDLYPKVPVGMRVTVTWQRFNGDPSLPATSATHRSRHRTASAATRARRDRARSAICRRRRRRTTAPTPWPRYTPKAARPRPTWPATRRPHQPAAKPAEHKSAEPKSVEAKAGEAKPVAKKVEHQKPDTATASVHDAAEAATAAAAASKAAAVAREAAEMAKSRRRCQEGNVRRPDGHKGHRTGT